MIVRDFNKIVDSERDRVVSDAQWTSVRMLLADDGMGFSFHITFLEGGSEHTFEYKNHFESVYCMKGKGSITDLATGETHEITPGVMYALNEHDRHVLRAEEELVMACVFNPPVTGTEVHREDGSYAAAEVA
ncbi:MULTISPECIES: ectoine synthase [Marinovum]|jgi:L-ectoine synthase|uniref:L-ectoine synthase n=1 Tax=Marinovum algicola TaxID=42444 RepID=A0A975WA90_9RHOB|nr:MULTISPECIES: ectoine synthase [Marinovum]AKO95290.1 Ectoine synthase [Marinovum algicola DG 898]MDD9738385.1 ectoine synthase [Marinovum sp. SP66]MDD9745501.1 ectoine synthase [Marinovum sp. PR37]SEJ50685.1 ectoine synthase [Marinovum algicola]SLN33141.1 L-ectoine synthase [Marinovum algicola]